MKIKQVLKAGEQFEIEYEDNSKKSIFLDSVKGGISWPTPNSPAYYLIIGKYSFPEQNLKKSLVLLTELEAELPEKLICDLYNDARNLRCREFFGEFEEATVEYCKLFDRYMDRLNANFIELLPAEIIDWNAGILRIQKYGAEESLDIPQDSILRRQLGDIRGADRENSQRHVFYALDALRCCIGNFEVPPTFAKPVNPYIYCY